MKRYAAVAGAFEVPYALTDAATLAELVNALYLPFATRAVERLAGDATLRDASFVTLRLNALGELELNLGPRREASAGPTKGRWGEVRLSRARAEELRARLDALAREFGSTDGPGEEAEPYLLGLMLVRGSLDGT
ncbi:hypothetical protein [Deinococcus pimensis]|uniref:hypothetical protein n=1 Tax=Deinococcus pimensis TaxID=309888 RepID=UPI000483CD52|nr:hypothetical protein [Deinococcus pimensis]